MTDQSDPKKLWNEITLAKSDTNKVKALINYGDYWIARNQDSVFKYFTLAKTLVFKTDNINLQEWSIEKFNVHYQNIGNYKAFIKNGEILLAFGNKYKLPKAQIRACLAIGTGYYSAGDMQKYLDYHILAQKIAEKNNLILKYPNIPYNIGEALTQMGQPKKALPYYYESIELCKKGKDDFYLAVSYYNLAIYYSGESKFDSSYHYHNKSLEVCKKINYDQLISANYGSLANNLFELKKPEQGLKMAKTGLEISEKSEFLIGKILAYIGLFQNYYGLNDIKNALNTGEIANKLIVENKLEADYYREFELLSEINLKAGKLEKAYGYLKKYKTWADSVSNNEIKAKINLIETQYKTEKNKKQIINLNNEKEIQKLQLKQKNVWLFALIGSIIAFSILGFQYYKNSKRKELLAQQSLQLQDQKIKELQQEKQLIASNSVIKGQEEERGRLAKDLHDGLGGLLSGIKFTLNSMTGNQVLSEQSSHTFHRAIGQLDNAISELRRVAHSMMPEALLKFGLKDALHDYCEGINQSGKLAVNFETWGLEERQEQSVEVSLYRIVQELLNNTIKHANATTAHIQLVQSDNLLTLTVEDNGKGFDINDLQKNKGAGISNVESRVAYLNGKMDIKSGPEIGTSIEVQVNI